MKTMTSRERIRAALRHEEPDRVPIDLGSSPVTGIHVSTYAKLRKALGFSPARVKVGEPFQMLAEVEPEVADALGVDTVPVRLPTTHFGFTNRNWKSLDLFDGTEVLVSGDFNHTVDENGDWLMHPLGDRQLPPSARMPKGGNFFDAIIRQRPLDEDRLDPREFAEEQIRGYTDEELGLLQAQAESLHRTTDKALVGWWFQGGIGDIAHVPGLHVPHPRGIRDPELWYESLLTRPEYIREIFAIHTEMAMENLRLLYEAVGDRLEVIAISGADFGTQRGPMIAPQMYRELFKPFHKQINDWVHAHTPWKTFFHSCGSVAAFLDDFVEAGVDILNPVQCSATGMDAQTLKDRYGRRLVFWGGGVNTQKTLPFATPDDVRREVAERVRIFGQGGGFVFNTIHNIQAQVPVENVVAMFETLLKRPLVRGESVPTAPTLAFAR